MNSQRRRYFSKPEGEDPAGKLISCLHVGSRVGIICGLYDIYIRTQCKTFYHAAQRFAFSFIPITGICFVYPSVTFISTRIRGKDDELNHGIGALSTLPIFRVWLKQPTHIVVQTGFALFLAAILNKGIRRDYIWEQYNPRSWVVPQFYD